MPANQCPKCGQAVMTYGRFLKEAEPTRISPCGSCGALLRRRKSVYLLLLIMSLLLIAGMLGLWLWPAPNWPRVTLGVLFLAAWTLLTNYLGWRLVGWMAVDEVRRRPL